MASSAVRVPAWSAASRAATSAAGRPRTNEQHPPARLDPGEPGADAQHRLIEFTPPAIQVYAEASGHRTVFCCPHTFGSSGGGRVTSTAVAPHDYEVPLED